MIEPGWSKCQFGMETCTYLGHIVGNGVVKAEASKIGAVESFAVPQTKKQVRAFLGLTGFYRHSSQSTQSWQPP